MNISVRQAVRKCSINMITRLDTIIHEASFAGHERYRKEI